MKVVNIVINKCFNKLGVHQLGLLIQILAFVKIRRDNTFTLPEGGEVIRITEMVILEEAGAVKQIGTDHNVFHIPSTSCIQQPYPDHDTELHWPWEEDEFKEAWDNWREYRKQRKLAKYVLKGEQMQLQGLYNETMGDLGMAIESIKISMSKNWNGIHVPQELKNNVQRKLTTQADVSAKIDELFR